VQSGTDDNSLKNVLAAEAEGIAVGDLVGRNADSFEDLSGQLALSFDDFIRTGSDPRHQPAVERLWRACAARGDLYRRQYQGLYCVGCEQFYRPAELTGGRCPEHDAEPQVVSEQNWFFRLSRYAGPLHDAISSGRLRIKPAARRNEVLAFIAAGLEDFSVSRSRARAHGWGIPVPGDPDQVMYVWWDALGNYISAPGYGTDDAGYGRWWLDADRRVHLAGKGVLRFHAVYWPAMLLSAGEPLPTDVLVHDYLTVDGRKISKSGGGAVDPVRLVREFGTDAVRWWLLRDVPRVGDADFTVGRLVARANGDLAGGLGNLVSRTVTMVHRYRAGVVPSGFGQVPSGFGQVPSGFGQVPSDSAAERLLAACSRAPGRIRAALDGFDFRAATAAAWDIVDEANRYLEQSSPWRLAQAERAAAGRGGQCGAASRAGIAGVDVSDVTDVTDVASGGEATGWHGAAGRGGAASQGDAAGRGSATDWHGAAGRGGAASQGDAAGRGSATGWDDAAGRLDAVLAVTVHACRCLAVQLAPFLPVTAERVAAQCGAPGAPGPLPDPEPVFPRIAT
jgi:methionyl-tRNA synthetase